MNVLTNTVKV